MLNLINLIFSIYGFSIFDLSLQRQQILHSSLFTLHFSLFTFHFFMSACNRSTAPVKGLIQSWVV